MSPKSLQAKVAIVATMILLLSLAIDTMADDDRRQKDGDNNEPMHSRLGDMVAS
jgi:hypothetical protein